MLLLIIYVMSFVNNIYNVFLRNKRTLPSFDSIVLLKQTYIVLR